MLKSKAVHIHLVLVFFLLGISGLSQEPPKFLPYLQVQPSIDGDLADWKEMAFTDGAWDLDRVKSSPWYEPKRNRLTVEDGENPNDIDLQSNYYMAWDNDYIYLGAEVIDNINDVSESKHEPKRWYYKDAIAWFIEAPKDTLNEKFGEGDHGFAFVLDTLRPDYGAWWRHGSKTESYIEEPLSNQACDYEIHIKKLGKSRLRYTLEARISIKETLLSGGKASPPQSGDSYGMMIVHCDPDGGEYGGHLLIHGKGDADNSWQEFKLGLNQSAIDSWQLPSAPSLNVRDFGAVDDKSILSTKAIQSAIDHAYLGGGGTISFPRGDYLTGTIVLKSGVHLHLDSGATIYASRNIEDYRMPLVDAIRPILIYANGATNIAITGKGRIDGQAEHVYSDLKKTDSFIKEYTELARESGVEMKQYYTVAPDVGLLSFSNCSYVRIKDAQFINSPFWNVHLVKCHQAVLEGLTIRSSLEKGVNSDGIDINSSSYVSIWNCDIRTGDDAIAIKSWYPVLNEHIYVSRCTLSSSSTALKIGTETHGDFKNIGFKDCTVLNSNRGLSIVVRDGGTVSDISFENISIDCQRRHFNWWGNGDPIWLFVTKKNKNSLTGAIKNVTFKNINAKGQGTSRIESTEGMRIENIKFHNVNLHMFAESTPDKRANDALYFNNTNQVELDSVKITWEENDVEKGWESALHLTEVSNVTIDHFQSRQGLLNSRHPVIIMDQVGVANIAKVEGLNGHGTLLEIKGERSKTISTVGVPEASVVVGEDVVDKASIKIKSE